MNVTVRQAAEADVEAAFDYYEAAGKGLGTRFTDEFRRSVDRIMMYRTAGSCLMPSSAGAGCIDSPTASSTGLMSMRGKSRSSRSTTSAAPRIAGAAERSDPQIASPTAPPP